MTSSGIHLRLEPSWAITAASDTGDGWHVALLAHSDGRTAAAIVRRVGDGIELHSRVKVDPDALCWLTSTHGVWRCLVALRRAS